MPRRRVLDVQSVLPCQVTVNQMSGSCSEKYEFFPCGSLSVCGKNLASVVKRGLMDASGTSAAPSDVAIDTSLTFGKNCLVQMTRYEKTSGYTPVHRAVWMRMNPILVFGILALFKLWSGSNKVREEL